MINVEAHSAHCRMASIMIKIAFSLSSEEGRKGKTVEPQNISVPYTIVGRGTFYLYLVPYGVRFLLRTNPAYKGVF